MEIVICFIDITPEAYNHYPCGSESFPKVCTSTPKDTPALLKPQDPKDKDMHKMHEVFFGYLFPKEQQCQGICTGPSINLLHICYVPPQQMLNLLVKNFLSLVFYLVHQTQEDSNIASHHGVERMTRIL